MPPSLWALKRTFQGNSLEFLPSVHRILLDPILLPSRQSDEESHALPHMHGKDE